MRAVTTSNQDHMRNLLMRLVNFPLPENTTCIGQEKDGSVIAVVGYCHFLPNSCHMHIGSCDEYWMDRNLLWAAFHYPFVSCNLRTVIGQVPASNQDAYRLNKHLGFKECGVIPDGHYDDDLQLMSMNKQECKWLDINCSLRTQYEQQHYKQQHYKEAA